MCREGSAKRLQRGPLTLPALEMEGGRAVVTAQEITTFFAAIAAVVVGGPAASPGLLLRLPTPLFCLVRLGGSQQSLDLLHTHTNGVCAHSELSGCPSPPRRSFSVTHPSPPFCPSSSHPDCSQNLSVPGTRGESTLTVFLQHNNENSFFQMGRIRVGGWGEGARFPARHFLVWTVGDSKARLGKGLKPGTRTCWGKAQRGPTRRGWGGPPVQRDGVGWRLGRENRGRRVGETAANVLGG